MSYRLINANAIAALWPEANDMPCIYADLPSGLDGGHYDMRESDELQRENAKLRELVRDMWHEGAFAPGACYVETDRLEERTRELGIEVDA